MNKGKKLLSLLLAFVLVFALCGTAFAADATAGEMAGQVVILHTNDVHGAIDGYAKIAAMKASYEAKGAYVLLMDAGDYSQGTTKVSVSKGANAVALMNLAGYDVAALGNHEFDYGYDQLKANLGSAKFAVVAANVLYNGSVAFKANTVFTAPNGTKIGVFGLDTPETATKANPAMIKGVTFSDPIATAKAQVAALEAEKCDLIVCLGHLGVDDESTGNRSTDLLAAVTGIDLFIDGHSHTVIDGMKNDYATGGTMLVSTGTAFANIGVVTYADGKLSSALVPVTADMAAAADVKAAADEITAKIEAEFGAVFAKTEVELNGNRAPGNRNMETNLGDLITDALVWQCGKSGIAVDAALTNGGGIRATVKAGDITKNNINTVLPFGNTLAIVKVTGAELIEALEASTYCTPTAIGGFPQVSGIVFTVDATKAFDAGDNYPGTTYAAPKSINRVSIQSVGGKAFDLKATYTIATNNFTAAGGDTYYVFANATSNVDTGYVMDEVVMDYITTKLGGVITAADYGTAKGRITVLYPFSDTATSAWYSSAVQYVYSNKIMNGMTATTFAPGTAMSRAMFVTMLYRAASSPAVEGKVSDVFSDCQDGTWYSDAVLWAYQNKIVKGMTATTFGPMVDMNREQMAAILYTYAVYNGATAITEADLSAYSDSAAVSDWAALGVTFCTAQKLLQGSNGAFDPAGSANRSMGATVMMRLGA